MNSITGEGRARLIKAVIDILSVIPNITIAELNNIIDELGLEPQCLEVAFMTNTTSDILEKLKPKL